MTSIVYVLDASIVAQYLITDTYTPQSRVLVAQLKMGVELCTPELCLAECANVLWKQVRFHGMPRPQAEQLIIDLGALTLTAMQTVILLPRALEIGLDHNLAVYNSIYIALAENLNAPLITVDQRQAQVARAVGVTLKPITDFPPTT